MRKIIRWPQKKNKKRGIKNLEIRREELVIRMQKLERECLIGGLHRN